MIKITTVTGQIAPEELELTDGHNHMWITGQKVPASDAPVLDQPAEILAELITYREAGGRSQVDCQPIFAGRDGNRLRWLSLESGVQIVACTGFHLQRYYPEEAPIWNMDGDQAYQLLSNEIKNGLQETRDSETGVVFPGFIKIAVEETLEKSPKHLVEAAVHASMDTGCLIELHTEKGQDIEAVTDFLVSLGLPPERLVICHIDKRPEIALHCDLASGGFGLEYDTFFRDKYQPEVNLWPLINEMVLAGYVQNLVFATDLADAGLWAFGNGVGIASFPIIVKARLRETGYEKKDILAMTGGNIARRLGIKLRSY